MPILKDALSFNIQSVTPGKIVQLAAALSFVLMGSFAPASAQTQEAAPAVTQSPQTQPAAPTTQPNVAPIQQQDRFVQPVSPAAPQPQDSVVQPVSPAAPQPEAPVAAVPPADVNMSISPSAVNSPVEVVDPQQRRDIPHDLSPWGMFMAADWVVKAVMIGLAIASVLTWTVLLAKTLELFGARIRANGTLQIVRNAKTLDEATQGIETKGGPAAMMVRMAKHEMTLSDGVVDHTDGGGIKERVTSVLNRIEVHAGRRMARGTGILATIGSISPFVGLFGTVWGIMNSFISISESQTTNLAIVAPGIAEALLATAIGLVAAIPAVVFYNVFARSITGYRHLLADVASGVERLVSRDLDFRRVPPGAAKANVTLVGR